jgi:hypothetical protein
MTLYTGGFSRFVTSTTAPIATGWNESCRAGFAPAGKPCLRTAHKIAYVIAAEPDTREPRTELRLHKCSDTLVQNTVGWYR